MGTVKQSWQGARSRSAGEHFEGMINAACNFYKGRDVAFIQKTPEPMKIIKPFDRNRGQFIACFEKQAQPDYKGILQDGTMILFDAKHTDQDRIRRDCITEEQEKCMDTYGAYGARCYVVVSIQFEDFYRVPWDVFKRMKEIFGHKYMAREELEPYRLKTHVGTLLFLDGIELKEEQQ